MLAGLLALLLAVCDPSGAQPAPFLAQVPGSPFAGGRRPAGLAFSPAGGLLAAADARAGEVSVFLIARNGALSPAAGSPHAAGSDPSSSPSARLEPGWWWPAGRGR